MRAPAVALLAAWCPLPPPPLVLLKQAGPLGKQDKLAAAAALRCACCTMLCCAALHCVLQAGGILIGVMATALAYFAAKSTWPSK